MSIRATRQILLLCWVALPIVLPRSVSAQATSAPTTPPGASEDAATEDGADESQPPEPIAAADITLRAAETARRLDDIGGTIAPNPDVTDLALEISEQTRTIADLQDQLNELTAASVTDRQLEDQRGKWREAQQRLDRWMSLVDARWKELQATREELEAIQQQWRLTRDAERADELPEQMMSRIEGIVGRSESLLETTQQRIDRVAAVVAQLAEAEQATSAALDRIDELAEGVARRLMSRDAPPLWRTESDQWRGLDDTTWKASQTWTQDLLAFAAQRWVRLLVHFLVLASFVVAAIATRRSSRNWPEGEELDRARFLVSRPYSVALVFAILAGVFIYGTLPAAARDFFHFAVLIPMLRLAPGLTNGTERLGLYGLLGLLALSLTLDLCPPDSLLLRVMLLATQMAAVTFVGYLMWRLPRPPSLSWRRVAALAGGMAALSLFAVALVANVLGWVTLARFLSENTLLVAEGALLAILFLRAGSALLPPITRYGAGRALRSVRRYPERFERVGRILLGLLLLSLWIRQATARFQLQEPILEEAEAWLATSLSWTGLDITVGDLLQATLVLLAAILVQRLARFLLQEEIFPRLRTPASSVAIFTTLAKYAILAVGLVMAGGALGFTATQLTVLFGALGVGIGFGLQNIVNNFVSGLILIFERPIKVGDVLESAGTWGTVKRIGVRATVLRTFDGAEIIVPNGDLVSKEIKNWTFTDPASRVEIPVGVAYGSDPAQVLDILGRVANENEFVLQEPEPLPLMVGFGDSSLNFSLLCWVKIEDRFTAVSQLHVAANEALDEAGITIPFPQRDLHLRSVDSAAAAWPDMVEGAS